MSMTEGTTPPFWIYTKSRPTKSQVENVETFTIIFLSISSLRIAHPQAWIQFSSLLLNLSIEVPEKKLENLRNFKRVYVKRAPADALSDPGLIVVVDPPLLLWISGHIRHCLYVPRLGLQPLVDEQLRILKYFLFSSNFTFLLSLFKYVPLRSWGRIPCWSSDCWSSPQSHGSCCQGSKIIISTTVNIWGEKKQV